MSPLRVLRGLIFGALGGLIGAILAEFLPLGSAFASAGLASLVALLAVFAALLILGHLGSVSFVGDPTSSLAGIWDG